MHSTCDSCFASRGNHARFPTSNCPNSHTVFCAVCKITLYAVDTCFIASFLFSKMDIDFSIGLGFDFESSVVSFRVFPLQLKYRCMVFTNTFKLVLCESTSIFEQIKKVYQYIKGINSNRHKSQFSVNHIC